MKVVGQPPDHVSPSTVAAGRTKVAGREDRTVGVTPTPQTPQEETVALSPLARALQTLRGELGDATTIDEKRVAELRAALEAGSYQPSARDVASALLRELAANRKP
ncbi:MAG: flagellar biosynthesis anti-sigma factor FlgM [Deltaproteobacteria bacterium]|nr:flagellar biosynthesis anti-sigma factor FlgM [Deltaproteobacteria bacterium]